MVEIDIIKIFNSYLEFFVFFSAPVDVIVCIFLLFLEPEANVLVQGKHIKSINAFSGNFYLDEDMLHFSSSAWSVSSS